MMIMAWGEAASDEYEKQQVIKHEKFMAQGEAISDEVGITIVKISPSPSLLHKCIFKQIQKV
jgi:hypothetical protein